MKFIVVKLKPKGSFHIGEREGWREGSKVYIPSDTLFSALCHSYLLLYGEVESLLKNFLDGKPPFLLSSAFPYWKDRFFFPVPKNQVPKGKDAKKIKFVELIGLQRLLAGESIEVILEESECVAMTDEGPWEIEDVPRISLSRWTNHPGENFFHFGRVTYKEDAGLFFLIRFKDNGFKKRLESTINLLIHEGIGGDKTVGMGLFEKPEYSEIEIIPPEQTDAVYSISLYYPKDVEIKDLNKGFYELEDRRGYIYLPFGQSLRRRSIKMFTEGSVFPNTLERQGMLVDVTPESFKHHKVYRYGMILSLPCRGEEVL
jgi:CRISPR-associated protein Csm4